MAQTIDAGQTIGLGLQAVGLLLSAAFSVYQARNLLSGSRSRLKTDLEILKLLDPKRTHYTTIRERAEAAIREIYGPSPSARPRVLRVHSWVDFALGGIVALVFTAWTVDIVRDGFSWWAVVTGFMALGGFGRFVDSFRHRAARERGRKR